MFKSLVGVLVCSWAWRIWQERDAGFTVEGEDVRNAVKKAGSLAHNLVLTRDSPYMGLSNYSQNSVRRR